MLDFVAHLNKSHALLKFKVNYNFQSKSVEFLDTIISISSDGFIKTTLYTKPGKKCSYLLPSSCHPSHVTENIPYSLALRLKRICSDADDFLVQLDFLKDLLLCRGYRSSYILCKFDRVKLLDRNTALKKVMKEPVKRIILSLPYDPRLPNVSGIIFKFWKVMTQNPFLKKIFPNPPMVCWSRPKNLREILIRAQLPKEISIRKSDRSKNGFKHCNKVTCKMCKMSPAFANFIVSSSTKEKIPIVSSLNCLSANVIYCITCKKQDRNCKNCPQYIGQTSRPVYKRFSEHFSSIKEDATAAVGKHFSKNGHKQSDMQIIPFEQIHSKNPFTILAREKMYIRKLDSVINVKI